MGNVLQRLSLGGLVVSLALLIGCGGDDGEAASGDATTEAGGTAADAEEPDPVTKAEFIEEADETCRRLQGDLGRLLLVDDYMKARGAATADLRELADAWRSYGESPSQGTVDKVTAIQEAQVKSAEAEFKIAEDYGFKNCSLGGKTG